MSAPVEQLLGVKPQKTAQATTSGEELRADAKPDSSDIQRVLMKRYADAYRESHVVIVIGTVVKVVAIVLAGVILVTCVSLMQRFVNEAGATLVVGLILAAAFAGPLFVLGVLVKSHGQTYEVILDGAVNGSRHLDNDQVATILRRKF